MFNSRALREKPGQILFKDRVRTVELAIAFRRIQCFKCDLKAIYKYRVQQFRKSPQPIDEPPDPSGKTENGFSEDDIARWKDMPRFAEIPETIKCKRCGEVLGLYTECIF